MIVKATESVEDIKAVLCDPAIYDKISDDNSINSEYFTPPINNDHLYVGGFVKGECVAIMVYHTYKDGLTCHVQVLPEFRKEYAQEFGEQSLLFRGTLPLYAEIPKLYGNVLNFAKLNGFKVIDTVKDDYLKNGVRYDIDVLRYK